MRYFNLRNFRDLACSCIDYHCKYPHTECLGCSMSTYCENYTDLSKEVENKPFAKARRYYIPLANFVIRWAEAVSLTNEKGYMEGRQYLKECGELGHC